MDISVLASVGSFVVSERVLKPKASVLVLLGIVLAYDLTTKTHDASSLRVYRGPALLAFTLLMAAYSLRTWRRNGVACDELLFLPGTAHGRQHGIDEQHQAQNNTATTELMNPSNEGDVAAGGVVLVRTPSRGMESSSSKRGIEMSSLSSHHNNNATQQHQQNRDRTLSHESSVSSLNRWDDDDDDNDSLEEQSLLADDPLSSSSVGLAMPDDSIRVRNASSADQDDDVMALNNARINTTTTATTNSTTITTTTARQRLQLAGEHRLEAFREAHPRITTLGSFFFFRSSTSSTQNAAYAPSGPSVVGAALDLCMPVLFNFHLFIEASNHIQDYGSETPAKILPLIFLTVLIFRSAVPPGRRGRFWNVLKFTMAAPTYRVRFRDAFVGDVLTSLVRPLQDVLFALSYYVTVIYGTVSGEYGLSASGQILESSWWLHNVVLPSAALLPLWWKFLQTLRACYDAGARWPHLGNAFKYLSAWGIVLYAMTHREEERSAVWVVLFVLALVYQVCWDIFFDWGLLVIVPNEHDDLCGCCNNGTVVSPLSSSSYHPDSCWWTWWARLMRPLRKMWSCVPHYRQIRLRPTRLYKTRSFYYKIVAYNIVFRWTWMLCFIPAYHVSNSGDSYRHVNTFSSDTKSYVGVLLPMAEILRRTLWGFLYLEHETIKMQTSLSANNPAYSRLDSMEMVPDQSEVSVDSVDSSKRHYRTAVLPAWMGSPQLRPHNATNPTSCLAPCWMKGGNSNSDGDSEEDVRHKQFLAELSVWAGAFLLLGLWATV